MQYPTVSSLLTNLVENTTRHLTQALGMYVRSAKFYSSTCQTHANDMLPQLKAVVEEGRTAVGIIVDGGPDWSPASLLNNLFFFRLWRDAGLDMLDVCSYAARYSAYNPIEHLWSPLSKKLSGVQFSSKAYGDTKPPCQISGLTAQEQRQKESEVFDRAIFDLCTVHWANVTFDGYPVTPVHVKCLNQSETYNDHDKVHAFLSCPLRDIKAGKYKKIEKEMREMLRHIQRHRNEVIFMKCSHSSCSHCTQNPVKAKKLFAMLKKMDMKMFAPLSKGNTGHYYTFKEMCDLEPEKLPTGDMGMPSSVGCDLGRCKYCPAYTFFSKTEKARHLKVFHSYHSKGSKSGQTKYICHYKVNKRIQNVVLPFLLDIN